MKKKIVVTGSSGLLGPSVVEHFLQHGYEVLGVDLNKPNNACTPHITADLTDLGQCYGALAGAYAVVHLAAIPVAYSHPNEVTFANNVLSTYNILEAAAGLGIRKAVVASSESIYGIVFSKKNLKPQYLPIDEEHPVLPEDSYGLSKVVNERIAESFFHRCDMQVVSLRIGNVITPQDYTRFPSFLKDPGQRRMIVWSYIDSRDIACACRLAVEAEGLGAVALNLAADDTCMDMTNRELLAAEYPDVEDIRVELDSHQTLLSNQKAKALLGWRPEHRWRDYVKM